MKCLVVTTHPLSDSLCKKLTHQVVNQLEGMGHEVVTEDLYGQAFNPALTVQERASYYRGSYEVSGVTEQVERLLEAEGLVLLFPTWWFGFPAMLKGWFDRVWGPGIAYDHASDFGPIKARLDRLRRVLVITTLGSPWWVDRLLLRQPQKRVLKLALLGTCAKRSKLTYLTLYKSEDLNQAQITKFSKSIEQALMRWY
ncbi:MAG: NAD(P)H-dependent oxidoreductase [Candidatus Thiodiazotropha sp. (ex Lucinoma borealis)]|nr:NAD(P)H-dependent oxidoreductase [Candidatus Thiodiazotropha sp. (ex Lucinoma borealis)]